MLFAENGSQCSIRVVSATRLLEQFQTVRIGGCSELIRAVADSGRDGQYAEPLLDNCFMFLNSVLPQKFCISFYTSIR